MKEKCWGKLINCTLKLISYARKVKLEYLGELRLLRDFLRVLGCNRRGSGHDQGARRACPQERGAQLCLQGQSGCLGTPGINSLFGYC